MTRVYYLDWNNVDFTWNDLFANWNYIVETIETPDEPNFKYFNWEEIATNWDYLFLDWELIGEVIRLIQKVGGAQAYIDGNPWDITKRELGEEKAKKFFECFCKINGLEYKNVIEPNKKIKITIQQIEKVINEAIKIDVKIKK